MPYHLFRMYKTLLTIHRVILPNYKKFLPVVKKHVFRTFAAVNTAAVAKIAAEQNEADLSFLLDVKNACLKNDDALKELMNILSICVAEISKEYQENIGKQIEIISKCTQLGPVGEHWDELIQYRVQANELRQELSKYEVLVQKVGQMAYNQAVTSLLSGVENAMDLVDVHFSNLEKTVANISKDNYQWETKLLYANRDSILHGLK